MANEEYGAEGSYKYLIESSNESETMKRSSTNWKSEERPWPKGGTNGNQMHWGKTGTVLTGKNILGQSRLEV